MCVCVCVCVIYTCTCVCVCARARALVLSLEGLSCGPFSHVNLVHGTNLYEGMVHGPYFSVEFWSPHGIQLQK